VEKLTAFGEAMIDVYLNAFMKEGVIPDQMDLAELNRRIDQTVGGPIGNAIYQPMPGSVELIRRIPQTIKYKLAVKVQELEQEARRAMRRPKENHTINIQGDNYGPVQSGG
jgi:hypothetical protein